VQTLNNAYLAGEVQAIGEDQTLDVARTAFAEAVTQGVDSTAEWGWRALRPLIQVLALLRDDRKGSDEQAGNASWDLRMIIKVTPAGRGPGAWF
jgi:hypothetical protein